MATHKEKCERLAALHAGDEAFIIPNPWDVGSARILESLGFRALATTSAGFAFTLGRSDGQPSLEEKLEHCRTVCAATTVPVNADFEDGFAADPDRVAANVLRVAEAGVAGCSVEDFSRENQTLFDPGLAAERVQAAAEAVSGLGVPFQLTARAELLLRGDYDLETVVERLHAYERAGAHVLYAPGIRSLDDLRQVTGEIDRPFNVLAPFMPDATVDDFAKAGATRISVGAALAWASLAPVLKAGRQMNEEGSFAWLREAAPGGEIARLLGS